MIHYAHNTNVLCYPNISSINNNCQGVVQTVLHYANNLVECIEKRNC